VFGVSVPLCNQACAFVYSLFRIRFGSSQPPLISCDEISEILKQRVDQRHESAGIVVGIIDPEGPRVISYGVLDHGDARLLNGDTIFEIGSVTKPFTSLLLVEMSLRAKSR